MQCFTLGAPIYVTACMLWSTGPCVTFYVFFFHFSLILQAPERCIIDLSAYVHMHQQVCGV
jgi:hypothetical protein